MALLYSYMGTSHKSFLFGSLFFTPDPLQQKGGVYNYHIFLVPAVSANKIYLMRKSKNKMSLKYVPQPGKLRFFGTHPNWAVSYMI